MTWTCLLEGCTVNGVGERERVIEERFNRGGKGNGSCKSLGAGKGEFFRRHRENWCGVKGTLQIHRVSLPMCQVEVAFLFGVCTALLTTSYILWYQSLHMKDNWDNFTLQWITLDCFGFSAEVLPRWSSLLQNIALSTLPFSRACPFPSSVPIALARTVLFLMGELSPPPHLIKPSPFCYSAY